MKFFIFSYTYRVRCLITLVLLLTLPKAFSQELAPVASSTPMAIIELNYQSVFSQYEGFQDQAVSSWLKNNATVAAIGGWRVYAKEALLPTSKPSESHQTSPHQHGSKP